MVSSLRHTVFKNFGKIDYLHYFRRMIKDYESKKWDFDIRTIVKNVKVEIPCPKYICKRGFSKRLCLELFNEFIKNPQNMSDVELSNAFARSIHIGHNKVFDLRNKANKLSLSELKTLELNSEKSLRSDLYENLFLELSKNEKFKDISSKYYDLYLENEFKECSREDATRYREMCKSIDKEYGVKVILPANLKEVGQSLILVYQELNNYKMHSNNQAKMPPVLDFMYPLADNAAGMAHIRDGNIVLPFKCSTLFFKCINRA